MLWFVLAGNIQKNIFGLCFKTKSLSVWILLNSASSNLQFVNETHACRSKPAPWPLTIWVHCWSVLCPLMLPGWIVATWKYKEWTVIFISGNKSDHLTFTVKPPMKASYTATVRLPCNTDLYLFLLKLVWDITTIILKDTHCDAVQLHIMGLYNISTSWFALCHWENSTVHRDAGSQTLRINDRGLFKNCLFLSNHENNDGQFTVETKDSTSLYPGIKTINFAFTKLR